MSAYRSPHTAAQLRADAALLVDEEEINSGISPRAHRSGRHHLPLMEVPKSSFGDRNWKRHRRSQYKNILL